MLATDNLSILFFCVCISIYDYISWVTAGNRGCTYIRIIEGSIIKGVVMAAWTQRRGDRRVLSWLGDFAGGMQPVLRDHREVAGT